jgi:hypothetical protein
MYISIYIEEKFFFLTLYLYLYLYLCLLIYISIYRSLYPSLSICKYLYQFPMSCCDDLLEACMVYNEACDLIELNASNAEEIEDMLREVISRTELCSSNPLCGAPPKAEKKRSKRKVAEEAHPHGESHVNDVLTRVRVHAEASVTLGRLLEHREPGVARSLYEKAIEAYPGANSNKHGRQL